MRTLNVLIVEDEPLMRELVHDMLLHENHRVDTCSSATEALNILRGGGIDLVITEYWLPGTSGGELAVMIKSLAVPRRVMLMTSHLPRRDLPAIDGVLMKPFSRVELQELIEDVMSPREVAA